jgi:undecaprenyl-diphosphatase
MDWSITHSLNSFLVSHDAIEDPLLAYVKVSEVLFLGMLLVVCALARHAPAAPVRRTAVAAGLSAALGLAVGKIITEVYDRARPFVAHPGQIHLFAPHPADASFPSDHATASIAIATAILLRHRFRWGSIVLAFAAILCFGRVALGYHYPTDVLGGAAIGALAATVLWLRPLRELIDRISDAVGGAYDRALDAVIPQRGAAVPTAAARPRAGSPED